VRFGLKINASGDAVLSAYEKNTDNFRAVCACHQHYSCVSIYITYRQIDPILNNASDSTILFDIVRVINHLYVCMYVRLRTFPDELNLRLYRASGGRSFILFMDNGHRHRLNKHNANHQYSKH